MHRAPLLTADSSSFVTDLAGVAQYLASAVRDGATEHDEAVLALAGWVTDDPRDAAPAAYLAADDDVAVQLLSDAVFDLLDVTAESL
jgi:hypothetical protein